MTKKAILFPGQGAQAVGMGKELADHSPAIRGLFDQASEILGYDLAQVCFEGPAEELTRSDRAQPAIFVHSIAAWHALKAAAPVAFDVAAGLSSGEWAALHMAGVVSYQDCLRILEVRGRLMQEACEASQGGMLSIIGLDVAQCSEIAAQAGVGVANLNSPAQTVLSGALDGIDRAEVLAKEAGAKRALKLNVSGAFHSELMAPAAAKFEEFLQGVEFSEPRIPVLSNVTGTVHKGAASVARLMAQQITSSVRWVEDVAWMSDNGVQTIVECGPGKVLSGLVKRIDKELSVHNVSDISSLETTRAALQS